MARDVAFLSHDHGKLRVATVTLRVDKVRLGVMAKRNLMDLCHRLQVPIHYFVDDWDSLDRREGSWWFTPSKALSCFLGQLGRFIAAISANRLVCLRTAGRFGSGSVGVLGKLAVILKADQRKRAFVFHELFL